MRQTNCIALDKLGAMERHRRNTGPPLPIQTDRCARELVPQSIHHSLGHAGLVGALHLRPNR